MDAATQALMFDHAAAKADLDPRSWCHALIRYDGTDLDGAIVELQLLDDGIFTGEVRIPGPPAP